MWSFVAEDWRHDSALLFLSYFFFSLFSSFSLSLSISISISISLSFNFSPSEADFSEGEPSAYLRKKKKKERKKERKKICIRRFENRGKKDTRGELKKKKISWKKSWFEKSFQTEKKKDRNRIKDKGRKRKKCLYFYIKFERIHDHT